MSGKDAKRQALLATPNSVHSSCGGCDLETESLVILATSPSSAGAAGPAHVGVASISTALSTLVLAVLGAGQLTLPYALSQLGLAFGLLALVFFTFLSAHSLHTLSVYSLHFKPDPKACLLSYSEMVEEVLGKPGSWICSTLLVLYQWGGGLSFMVILKVELHSVVHAFAGLDVSEGLLLAGVAAAFIWPLSALQDLSSLKRFCPLGCMAAIFITCVVLMCTNWTFEQPVGAEVCAGPFGRQDGGTLRYWPVSFLGVAASLPLLAFALNSSWAYIPILCTLRSKTERRVTGLIVASNAAIFVNYILISVYGYATFCDLTSPNILDSLGSAAPPGSGPIGNLVMLARAALAMQLTIALPMRFWGARKVIGGDMPGLVGRTALAFVLVASSTALAVTPLSLATVLGIVSSVCASMIIYILPAVVDLRVQLPGRLRKAASLLSLLVGLFILVAGLAANLLGVAVGG